MRPILRGPWPQDENGNKVQYKDYANARRELISRIGECCSYCEMHLDSALAIEHVQPKKPKGAIATIVSRELDWNNFLLACPNCNAVKGNKNVEMNDYFWPDRDNTFRIFRYTEGGVITLAAFLSNDEKIIAENTISLTGLTKNPNTQKASDRRWNNRRECWDIAERAKERLGRNDSIDLRDQIVETASAKGFWSIWMTVFQDDSDMKKRLISAIPGTAIECFREGDYHPIHRPGGRI